LRLREFGEVEGEFVTPDFQWKGPFPRWLGFHLPDGAPCAQLPE